MTKLLTAEPFNGSRRWTASDGTPFNVSFDPEGIRFTPVYGPGRRAHAPRPTFRVPYARLNDLLTPEAVHYEPGHEGNVTNVLGRDALGVPETKREPSNQPEPKPAVATEINADTFTDILAAIMRGHPGTKLEGTTHTTAMIELRNVPILAKTLGVPADAPVYAAVSVAGSGFRYSLLRTLSIAPEWAGEPMPATEVSAQILRAIRGESPTSSAVDDLDLDLDLSL